MKKLERMGKIMARICRMSRMCDKAREMGYRSAKKILGHDRAITLDLVDALAVEYMELYESMVTDRLQTIYEGCAFELEDWQIHGWTDDGDEYIIDEENNWDVWKIKGDVKYELDHISKDEWLAHIN